MSGVTARPPGAAITETPSGPVLQGPGGPFGLLTAAEGASVRGLAAGGWTAKKAPMAQVGGGAQISLSDVIVLSGAPNVTIENGPNGQPAIKIVTGVGANAEIAFPGLVGHTFMGEAYLSIHGSRSQGNIDYLTVAMSQDNSSYAKGTNTTIQYGQPSPINTFIEQGGANTYWWRVGAQSNLASAVTYPAIIGQIKLRVAPLAGTSATVWIYAFGIASPRQKGRICVVWDDGYDSMFGLGYDAFASRSIKQTLSVIGSNQNLGGGSSFSRQLSNFVAAGNACVAHGPMANLGIGNLYSAYPGSANPVYDAVADMRSARDWIYANGLVTPGFEKCYVWPQGQFQTASNDTTLLDAAHAAGFTLCRSVGNLTASALYGHGVQIDALSKYNRMACPILGHTWAGTTAAEATNITAITTAINNLSASRGDAFLMLHRVLPSLTSDATMGSAGNITIRRADLDTIAAAIKTGIDGGALEAVTMPELATDTFWAKF